VVLAAAAALLACARPAGAATVPPQPISITIDDGFSASDGSNALPSVVFGTGESVATSDAALLRLAITLARSEGVAVVDDPSILLGILLKDGEPITSADAVALLLGIRLQDGETVAGTDAVSLLLGIRLADGETVTGSDLVSLLLGIRQTVNETVSVGDEVSAKAIVVPTTTTLTTSGSPALAGTSVTFTASIASAGNPVRAGSVVFSVDGAPVGQPVPVDGNGVAQLTTSALALGSHTVRAAYGGTAAYLPSSATVSQGVWDFTLSLTPSDLTVQRGDTASFTVTAAPVQGSVTEGLPFLTLAASEGTVARQLAVPGTTVLQISTGPADPPGRRTVTVTPLGVDQHAATAHVYVNDPPVPVAGGPYAADENTTLTLHGSATDADGDTLTYAWDVGGVKATGADATITVPDGPATVPVTLTVCDDHGACANAATTLTIANVPPAVTLTATPSPVNEGGTFTLAAAIKDSAADTAAGFAIAFDCGAGTFVTSATPSTVCPAIDDPGVTARAQVTDKDGGTTIATVAVPIRNVAPAVTITAPAPGSVVFVGHAVSLAASFTDPGVRDTHTGSFAVAGTTVPAAVTESGGSGTTAATWTPAAAGIDTLTANVSDNAGATRSASQSLIVADPFGFTSGNGWVGPAHNRLLFTLDAHYPRGAATPTGSVTVDGRGVVFRATSFAWLVVSGRTATLQGTGIANGSGGYSFLLQAVDGRPNQFAMRIWKTSTGAVLLDTGAPAPLGGGNVTVGG
jgi:hypothetical protein